MVHPFPQIEVEVDVEVEVEESADEPLVIDVIDANAAEDLAGKQVDPIEAEKAEEKEEKVEGEKFEEKVEENEEKLEEDIIEAKEEEVVESKESESEEEVVEEKVEGVQVQDKAGEVEEGITEIKPEQKKQTIIEKQVQSKKYPLKVCLYTALFCILYPFGPLWLVLDHCYFGPQTRATYKYSVQSFSGTVSTILYNCIITHLALVLWMPRTRVASINKKKSTLLRPMFTRWRRKLDGGGGGWC